MKSRRTPRSRPVEIVPSPIDLQGAAAAEAVAEPPSRRHDPPTRPSRPSARPSAPRSNRPRPTTGVVVGRLAVRASEETLAQLTTLAELWGCSATDAVRKAIADALLRATEHHHRSRHGR